MTWIRAWTAVVLIPAVVAVVLWGSTRLVAALTGLVTLLALLEFFALGERAGLRGYRIWTGVCALGLLFGQWSSAAVESWDLAGGLHLIRGARGVALPLDLVLLIFILGVAVQAFASRRPLQELLPAVGMSAAGLVFVALPFSYLVRIHGASTHGPRWLLFFLVLIWVGDTLAFFVGRAVGRLPMAPQLSPKKTWEGAAANLLGSLLAAGIFARWLAEPARVSAWHLLVLAALANVAGQAGDLLESAYKRSAGVKDSGTLLPGHGGVLDRIDALILGAPVVWYYLEMVIQRGG